MYCYRPAFVGDNRLLSCPPPLPSKEQVLMPPLQKVCETQKVHRMIPNSIEQSLS
jgi:hypothetical protein